MVENGKRERYRSKKDRESRKRERYRSKKERESRKREKKGPLKMVQHFIFDLNPIREREREATGKKKKQHSFSLFFDLRVHGERE